MYSHNRYIFCKVASMGIGSEVLSHSMWGSSMALAEMVEERVSGTGRVVMLLQRWASLRCLCRHGIDKISDMARSFAVSP
jgi:hypothetical protein